MEHPKLRLTISWDDIELSAQQQIIKLLHLPELKTLAIMPDVHAGADEKVSLCVGGVALLDQVICPYFPGFDIGCGMCHISLNDTLEFFKLDTEETRIEFFTLLQEHIPVGLGKPDADFDSKRKIKRDKVFTCMSDFTLEDLTLESDMLPQHVVDRINIIAPHQLGTLGSGNHFLEIGTDSEGCVGVTIHSGSRRPGYDIASWYMKQKPFLNIYELLGKSYIKDLEWASNYAYLNRKIMMVYVLLLLGLPPHEVQSYLKNMINEHHNHVIVNPDGTVLHRKGATAAEKDQYGIIPANQKDGVWLTRGLGNEEFLCSASHGAGRTCSRKAARELGTVDDLKTHMGEIVCKTTESVLDEAPWAYKDISGVLEAQDGILVDVLDHFKPAIVLKG